MPMRLEGSCRCGAVRFALDSHTPYPYQRCYCSICRKSAGGGGYAINIMGVARQPHSVKQPDRRGGGATAECEVLAKVNPKPKSPRHSHGPSLHPEPNCSAEEAAAL